MNKVNIQAIHVQADESLKEYIQKKCEKFWHYFDQIMDVEVFLKVDNSHAVDNQVVEIKVHVPGQQLVASEKGQSFQAATDLCTDKLIAQIKKFKDKIHKH